MHGRPEGDFKDWKHQSNNLQVSKKNFQMNTFCFTTNTLKYHLFEVIWASAKNMY